MPKGTRGTIFLAAAHPRLAAQFRRNITRPENDNPATIWPQCNDRAEFECQCGEPYESRIAHAHRDNTILCKSCRRIGKSRLEFEVAALLELALKTEVLQNHGNYHWGNKISPIDIYIPLLDTAIQLDPWHSHFKKHATDMRIYDIMKERHNLVLRIREEGLQPVGNSVEVPKSSSAITYFEAALTVIPKSFKRTLAGTEVVQALELANQRWDRQSLKPEKSILNRPYGKEFVRNLTHPGKKAEYIAAASRDICEWKCEKGHTWPIAVYVRNHGTRCPQCYAEDRFVAPYERSLACKNPIMAACFVRLVKSELSHLTAEQVHQASMELADWHCPDCGKEWTLSVNSQSKRICHAGCPLARPRKIRKDKDTINHVLHARRPTAKLVI